MTLLSVYLAAFMFCLHGGIIGFASEDKANGTDVTRIEGCDSCGLYRCPENTSKCLLGSVPDSCECCPGGLCAKLDGEACWNSSIARLPLKTRSEGYCARNYLCQLRTDLQDEDEPEAVCVCMEQSSACGNDNETYATPCALHEEAMRQRNSSLKLRHLGPCVSRPWIVTPLEDVVTDSGQRVVLHCETKGFPLPDVIWEFHSSNGHRVLKLPNKEHEATVQTSEGPEALMRTSWLQLAKFSENHVGTYHCITNNTIGDSSTAAFVSLG
ncbi:insulin-like growth factor-binding protein-related protein 1 [Venturia canescens]|uniref:insulin-like growth factor-binding protein-related protein 1 n=1 Tax=Venturia canescens TaxID=32260 RepID=UPI001C9C3CD9|nr:insulin-like growth factor-binding protein-related protein 1 [Venturia canescens]